MNFRTWSVAKLVIATDVQEEKFQWAEFRGTADKGDAVGPVAMAQLDQKYVPLGVICVLRLLVIPSVLFGMFNYGI